MRHKLQTIWGFSSLKPDPSELSSLSEEQLALAAERLANSSLQSLVSASIISLYMLATWKNKDFNNVLTRIDNEQINKLVEAKKLDIGYLAIWDDQTYERVANRLSDTVVYTSVLNGILSLRAVVVYDDDKFNMKKPSTDCSFAEHVRGNSTGRHTIETRQRSNHSHVKSSTSHSAAKENIPPPPAAQVTRR